MAVIEIDAKIVHWCMRCGRPGWRQVAAVLFFLTIIAKEIPLL